MELRNDLTPNEIGKYLESNPCLEQAVGLNRHKWTSNKLFTVGASACFIPVVFAEDSGRLGLGHYYPSIANLGSPLTTYQAVSRADYSSYIREAGQMVNEGRKVRMYLFGGSVGDEEYLEKSRDAVMRKFSALGIECMSITSPQPQSALELIIANIQDRTIRYCYKPDKLINAAQLLL